MMKGELLWQGKPSPLAYTKIYLLCALTSWLGFPLWLAFRKYRQTRTTLYEVSTCSVGEYTRSILPETVSWNWTESGMWK